jgi:hypothetical protein
MKRRTFCCKASQGMYEDYYARQNGGVEIPLFASARQQRGHGLGSMLSGLFRRIIVPFFKNNGKTLASTALGTGMQMADDVIGGKCFTRIRQDAWTRSTLQRQIETMDCSRELVSRQTVGWWT